MNLKLLIIASVTEYEVRRICKLNTRKLYDYKEHEYVTFDHISDRVNEGERVLVTTEDGKNVTNQTLIKALGRRSDKIETKDLVKLIKKTYWEINHGN